MRQVNKNIKGAFGTAHDNIVHKNNNVSITGKNPVNIFNDTYSLLKSENKSLKKEIRELTRVIEHQKKYILAQNNLINGYIKKWMKFSQDSILPIIYKKKNHHQVKEVASWLLFILAGM